MAEVKWTEEQKQAIESKGSNILVAAAAGSGKTAVLVERIINKVINDKIDIDKILVVTFTNAAASEMRERILEAIYKKIEENPDDKNMQKQIILLNKASICTIHAFCLEVIKNNFFEINTSANFRIGDTAEIELLKQDVIDDLFEDKYLNESKEFLKLINTYTGYRGDEPLKELILNVYKYIQSSPNPMQWLDEKVEMFNSQNVANQDFAITPWGKILIENITDNILDCIVKLKKLEIDLGKYDELIKFKLVISEDILKLEAIIKNSDSWDKVFEIISELQFTTWPRDKKVTVAFKDEAKEIRDSVKEKIKKIKEKFMLYDSKQAQDDISQMYEILLQIKNVVIEFSERFAGRKREKNIIDFNDIEHFALNILLKNQDGKLVETDVAKNYKQKFQEIAIDEYQDSNMVQEQILASVSNANNIFMVGDVKQSIYKFRQARPELFLEKYAKYGLKNENIDQGLKIQLFKNFRSRSNILDVTNIIFENIMSSNLGDIEYNKSEFLNLGANYAQPEENIEYAGNAELHIIDVKEQEDIEDDETTEEPIERIEDVTLEAKFVANKIKQLINSNYMVYDKKVGYRKITHKDIVVLLRATSVPAPIYENEISELDIPVFSDTSSDYLDTYEIQTMMCLLKIIDNPMQDIPLITVMRSCIGGFSDNDLVEIRLFDSGGMFYQTLMKCQAEGKLKTKIDTFLNNLAKWQEQEKYMALDELIWQIYQDTGFYHYVSLMPNGALRQANLKMLFERAKQYESASFKGLFNFISFIDKLHSSSGDLGSAKIIGEAENVVRIMSIHKSKGLEFPVVFLCGTGKKFNMQDLNQSIILHQDLGFGPKYINEQRRIEYPTLAKEAISLTTKYESMSEEMRVLYVALTRAKEKLIITGICKDAEKSILDKQKLIDMYKGIDKSSAINDKIIKKYKSYLDWIQLVYIKNDELKSKMDINFHKKCDLLKQFLDKSNENKEEDIYNKINENLQDVTVEQMQEVEDIIKWKYEHLQASAIPTKTSVTKIKQKSMEDSPNILEPQQSIIEPPKFLAQNEKLTGAQKGTLMHMCFQKLDVSKNYDINDIKELISELAKREIISEEESKIININNLYEYTKSELWKELKHAKKIYKEQPFYINIKSDEIYKDESEENILVQGVIDLFYINENDELILVDYKTDYVENAQQLIDKYNKQLELYSIALEKSLKRKVDKKCIYSVKLNELIYLK